jgi:hypothetical protein
MHAPRSRLAIVRKANAKCCFNFRNIGHTIYRCETVDAQYYGWHSW